MLHPWSRTLCPFCFETFHLSDAPWRPLDGTVSGPDELARQFFRQLEPVIMPPVLPLEWERGSPTPTGPAGPGWLARQALWLKRRFLLDNSRIRDHDRVCKFCHMPLPQAVATGELDCRPIAIIGERYSGKSVYFGILVHLLTNGALARDAGFGVVAQTSWDLGAQDKILSTELYAKRYGQYLFGERQSVPPTRRLRDAPDQRAPLIYRLMFFRRGPDGQMIRPAQIVHAIDLILFDNSGEDLEDPATMTLTMKYLTQAAGIVFLVNPLRLQGVRKQLSTTVLERMPEDERNSPSVAGNVLDTFLGLFDRDLRHGAKKTIDIPISVALTKIDMLWELIDPGSRLRTSPNHRGGFDLQDAQHISAEVRGYIEQWAGGPIGMNLDRFTSARFFAISSLGCQPEGNGTIPKISPHRVADPLFWILHRLGYLPATQSTMGGQR